MAALEIKHIKENKKRFLPLLLLADEEEAMIDRYLDRGDLFALYDQGLKSIAVVTGETDEICELKSLATREEDWGRGYATRLLGHLFAHYKGSYKAMLVGTGEVPWILRFYEKNGFSPSHRIENFFTDHYDHAMFEEGIRLVDMVYLKKGL